MYRIFTRIAEMREKLVQECAGLDGQLAAANSKASEVPVLEAEVERLKSRLAERDKEFQQERTAYLESEQRGKDANQLVSQSREGREHIPGAGANRARAWDVRHNPWPLARRRAWAKRVRNITGS
eukprot:1188601-Prorocentrum_minimum.AAC.2